MGGEGRRIIRDSSVVVDARGRVAKERRRETRSIAERLRVRTAVDRGNRNLSASGAVTARPPV